jgi:hypothetical protein
MGLRRALDEGKGRARMTGKCKVMMMALLAMFVLSTVAASGASGSEWLSLGGVAVTKSESATTAGSTLFLVVKIPALEGGGLIDILCDSQLLGTVNTGGAGTITLSENLAGTELDTVVCEVSKSTNSICKAGTSVKVTTDGLPWTTKLVLSGTTIFNDLSATEVGYSVTCSSITNKCVVGLELEKFVKNVATGAEFEFAQLEKAACTIGGEGTASGRGIVEKFLAN